MTKTKARNPQDTTLRNVRAAHKRLDALALEVMEMRIDLHTIQTYLDIQPIPKGRKRARR